MSARRRLGRFAAWLALAATLLSGVPPAGAHVRLADRLGDHTDFCSTSGALLPGHANPHPAGHDSQACTHCDGCTGNAGSHAAPLPATAQLVVVAGASARIAASSSPAIRSTDLLAAPPRGPPHLA